MSKNNIKIKLIMMIVACAFVMSYSSYSVAAVTTSPQTIKKIETGWSSEGIYITTVEGEVVEGCNYARFKVSASHMMLKEILSIALSAYHTKSQVHFRVNGCSGNDMNATAIGVSG